MKIKCPKCGNSEIVKYGYVPTVSRGILQRLRCNNGHTFYLAKDYKKRSR
jgi:hypothetical protein